MNNKKIVELQLDREINNFLETAVYCPHKYPAVITVKPFANNNAAPTIYWLSCPYLNYELDRLEAESNLITELGNKLKTDPEFKMAMDSAHQRYAASRAELLSDEELNQAQDISEDLYKMLLESGVGGIREKEGIKCLHTHLADFLVENDNPVGEIAFSRVSWPEECKICEERVDQFESSSD